jgi:hypothetical protein
VNFRNIGGYGLQDGIRVVETLGKAAIFKSPAENVTGLWNTIKDAYCNDGFRSSGNDAQGEGRAWAIGWDAAMTVASACFPLATAAAVALGSTNAAVLEHGCDHRRAVRNITSSAAAAAAFALTATLIAPVLAPLAAAIAYAPKIYADVNDTWLRPATTKEQPGEGYRP